MKHFYFQKQKFKDMEAALINDSTSYDSSSNSNVETESKLKFIFRIV